MFFEEPREVKTIRIAHAGRDVVELALGSGQQAAGLMETEVDDESERTVTGVVGKLMAQPGFRDMTSSRGFGQGNFFTVIVVQKSDGLLQFLQVLGRPFGKVRLVQTRDGFQTSLGVKASEHKLRQGGAFQQDTAPTTVAP